MVMVRIIGQVKVNYVIIWSQVYDVDVMKVSFVQGQVKRRFNNAMRHAPKDQQVQGMFSGQLAEPPYSTYDGYIGGVNGRVLARKGAFEYDRQQ